MNHLRIRRRPAFFLGMVFIIIASGVVYYFALGRSPLEGEMSYDFGIVPVQKGGTMIEHTFALRNRTRKTLEITYVKTSCGCAVADISRHEVQPGETVDIKAKLNLTGSLLKQETVSLVLKGLGVRQLSLRARGRRIEKLRSDDSFIIASAGEDTRFQLFAELWEGDSRDPPTVSASEGVRVTIEDWKETRAGIPREGRPATWIAVLLIHPDLEAMEPLEVKIALKEGQSLTLPLQIE